MAPHKAGGRATTRVGRGSAGPHTAPQGERDQDLYSLSSLRPELVIARRAGRSVTRRTAPVLTKAFSASVRARKLRRDRVAASSSLNRTPASPCWAAKPSTVQDRDGAKTL